MVRLLLGHGMIQDRDTGINLLEKMPKGLMLIEVDPQTREALPGFVVREVATLPTPYVGRIIWEIEGHEQLIITDDNIFLEDVVLDRVDHQKLVMPIKKSQLKSFQSALQGSGLRLFAYGSTDDAEARVFEIVRSGATPPDEKEDHPLLGQVDIETGEIIEV